MATDEYYLTDEEAEAITSCVRIVKGMLEKRVLGLENADYFHKVATQCLYKLTQGKEGMRVNGS